MKFIKFFFIIFIAINFFKHAPASVLKTNLSNKYFDIFSKPVLLNDDIERYQIITEFQESCNWKLANKYILFNLVSFFQLFFSSSFFSVQYLKLII